MKGKQRLQIGKVPLDVVTFAETLDTIEQVIAARQGGYIFTPNLDHFVLAEDHPDFAEAYQRAHLSVADGTWVVWASKLFATPVPEKISGSDLMEPLMARAGERKWRVGFLGAGPGIAEKAAQLCRERFGTDVTYVDSPRLRIDDASTVEAIAEGLAAAKVDLALLAFGSPKQEQLIGRIAERVKPTVMVGVGASFDFLTGNVKRAPKVVSRVGLEWAYRLVLEPRRLWRRYLVNDPRFALILARTLRDQRR